MNPEVRSCQNCKNDFTIEPDDFVFYEKIKVPPPTFCPECRFQQRYMFRNTLSLYKRVCDMCHKSIIAQYSDKSPFPVYCRDCFFSDNWDAVDYGRAYDFSRSFFDQYEDLNKVVPRISLISTKCVDSDYVNHATEDKSCYLCFSIGQSEDCYYCGPQIASNKNLVSCSMCRNCEFSYDLLNCEKCYQLVSSENCENCLDSYFLFDCKNCSNCIGCTNLRNKNYCIFNKQYTKEAYEEVKESFKLGTKEGYDNVKTQFLHLKKDAVYRFALLLSTVNSTGDNVINSKNCRHCFSTYDSEDTKFGLICNGAKDSYDISNTYPSTELSYFSNAPIFSTRSFFSSFCYSNCSNNWYSDGLHSSTNTFGCISLRKKTNCILNKEYSDEEYNEMFEKIKQHMKDMSYTDKQGRVFSFGDFFPYNLSPFGYNETASFDYFPLTKDEILEKGFNYQEVEEKIYQITMESKNLPDITKIPESICNEIISCEHGKKCNEHCSGAYRIMPQELSIYRRLGVAFPSTCPNCRTGDRYKRQNPMKLWHRKCMNNGCSNEFETPYTPDRPEKVYCEKCYQQEVL